MPPGSPPPPPEGWWDATVPPRPPAPGESGAPGTWPTHAWPQHGWPGRPWPQQQWPQQQWPQQQWPGGTGPGAWSRGDTWAPQGSPGWQQPGWPQPGWNVPGRPGAPTAPPRRSGALAAFAAIIAVVALAMGAIGLGQILLGRVDTAALGSPPIDRALERGGTRSPAQVPGADPSPTEGWPAVAERVHPGVVDIRTSLLRGVGYGTGMILTEDGRIVTNNHVIDGARRIVVTTVVDGRQYRATVVGTDPANDVAVLQLEDASGLTPIALGDSDEVRRGDAVAAIGNAGGRGGTPALAAGSVLDTDSSIIASDTGTSAGAQRLEGMIEAAADVQPGDSGGPMVDADGKVIGMTTAASAATGQRPGEQPRGGGLGYAIPINRVLQIVDDLTR